MKKLPIVCFLAFAVSASLKAQETLEIPKTAQQTAVIVPKSYELAREQSNAWRAIQQEWIKTEYPKILKEQKLQMNCSGCENIYMDAVFAIDATGKLSHYELVNSKQCTNKFSKALELKFTKWFFTLQFPPELHNLNFEVRLGTGLSC